jgi:hypothetical protein
MARSHPPEQEAVVTIAAANSGGAIDRGDSHGNGRNGAGRTSRNAAPRVVVPAVRPSPAQGELILAGAATELSGDREKIKPGVYYDQKTAAVLRGFISHLTDEAQVAHYTGVVAELSRSLTLDQRSREEYSQAYYDIACRGTEEVADETVTCYQDQLRKSLLIIEGYPEADADTAPTQARLEQERALLIYAEFLLAQTQLWSVHPDQQRRGQAFNLEQALSTLRAPDEQKRQLAQAFHGLATFADFSYVQSSTKVATALDEYEPPDNPAVRATGDVRLNQRLVERHIELANDQIEGAHRLVIAVLDGLNEPARQAWLAERERNRAIDLAEHPFSTWETQIAEKNGVTLQAGEHLPSDCYINGLLGTEKSQPGLFGMQTRHTLKHVIKNTEHIAPVRFAGTGRESKEKVAAAELTLLSGVYQGEWNQGATLKPGESRPKDFFDKVVDVTVWSVTLNSADAVENFIDQLKEADAVVTSGADVTQVLGKYEGSTLHGAQAFRVPILNHRGEPAFIVVDRATMVEMMRVAQISKESYRHLASRDPRYAVSPKETRWAAFRPQLRQHDTTPVSWVDQERDFMLVEDMLMERIVPLRAARTSRADAFVAEQLTFALSAYRRHFNLFQLNYCRLSRYRAAATARLALRNVSAGAPDYANLLRGELNAVALEYMHRSNAFRNVTSRLLDPQAVGAELQELAEFLANIDFEVETQVRVNSTDIHERGVRGAFAVLRRKLTRTPAVTTIAPVALAETPAALAAQVAEETPEADLAELPSVVVADLTAAESAPAPEVATAQVSEQAFFAAVENHDDRGSAWNESAVPYQGYTAEALRAIVDTATQWNFSLSKDTNPSKVAFIEPELSHLPTNITLVGFQVRGKHTDSSGRPGALSGVLVLPAAFAGSLRERLLSHPDELFAMITAINGRPLYTEGGRPIELVKGQQLSVYSMNPLNRRGQLRVEQSAQFAEESAPTSAAPTGTVGIFTRLPSSARPGVNPQA